MENVADALGVVSARVQGDLNRFKAFIETRHTETGAWRGEIHGREVQPEGTTGASNPSLPRSKRLRSDAQKDIPVANQNASGKLG
jgi:hypothetical protein